jgi:hypothetical protein
MLRDRKNNDLAGRGVENRPALTVGVIVVCAVVEHKAVEPAQGAIGGTTVDVDIGGQHSSALRDKYALDLGEPLWIVYDATHGSV